MGLGGMICMQITADSFLKTPKGCLGTSNNEGHLQWSQIRPCRLSLLCMNPSVSDTSAWANKVAREDGGQRRWRLSSAVPSIRAGRTHVKKQRSVGNTAWIFETLIWQSLSCLLSCSGDIRCACSDGGPNFPFGNISPYHPGINDTGGDLGLSAQSWLWQRSLPCKKIGGAWYPLTRDPLAYASVSHPAWQRWHPSLITGP